MHNTATVNKIKQKLRNAILQDPSIAPLLLELSITDALGYNAISGEGGQDGSIIFELSTDGADGLNKASKVLKDIQKELQRTNTVTFGDLVAFGGAEALESVGCSRVTVQVGRYDIKSANPNPAILSWESPSPTEIISAFKRSSLTAQQIALFLGAIGEISRIVSETALSKAKASDDDDDEEDEGPFVPTTFGSRDAMYGAKIGKADFGAKYFSSILKNKISNDDKLASILLNNQEIKAYVQKYATNEPAFIKDVTDAYLQLTNIGQELTTRNS